MIKYTDGQKDLKIPRNLGNFGGGSSGSGITEEECQQMIDDSLEDYYTSGQTDEKLQDYATTAVTADLQDQINALTGQTGGSEVEWNQTVTAGTKIATVTIDGTPTDVYAPQGGQGGVTPEQVQQQIDSALTGYYTSGQTDTILEGYATTADTESISDSASTAYDAVFYEDESGETHNQIDELWSAMDEKQDSLNFGSGLTNDDNTVKVLVGPGLEIEDTGEDFNPVRVKIGKGLETDENSALGLNIGEGLEFSGDTLVVDAEVIDKVNDAYGEIFYEDESGNTQSNIADLDDRVTELENESVDYATTADTAALEAQISAITVPNVHIIDPLTVYNMEYSDRRALFNSVVDWIESGDTVMVTGITNDNKTVITLPLVKFTKGTWSTDRYNGGFINFASKSDEQNRYYAWGMSSAGNTSGTLNNNGKFLISGNTIYEYTLPAASANTLGGIKVGSGLTIDANGVLSVSGGTSGGDEFQYTDTDEYNTWSQAVREAWYDHVLQEYYSGNTKIAIVKKLEQGINSDNGKPYAKYVVLTPYWIEDGYESIHFVGYATEVPGSNKVII